MQPTSTLVLLGQTALITIGGLLFVRLVAGASTMSDGELFIGPLSVALIWLGMGGAHPRPPRAV